MYTLSNRLRLFSIILVEDGSIGLISGFLGRPGSIDEVKEMMASHGAHGEGHGESKVDIKSHGTETFTHGDDAHGGDAHYEHVLHQLQNKPWAALYIAAFFFFMISLGVLAFYAIQYVAVAGGGGS